MRTILAGLTTLREAPLALAPLAAEGVIAAALVVTGAFPGNGSAAASAAVFPLDVFFDAKQALAHGRGWPWFAAAAVLSVLLRGGVLAATLWLKDGRPVAFEVAWWRCLRLVAFAFVAMLPSAVLFFAGVAIRYAPFVWAAALLGFVPAVYCARRAAALDVGAGSPAGKGVPEIGTFLGYAFVVTTLAAAMSVLGGTGRWATALLLACTGPLHALYLLGWRSHLEEETYPAGGAVAVAVTIVTVLALGAATLFDRYVREAPPAGRAPAEGTLALLGGADSTSETGALSEIDPRDFGFVASDTVVLSYARAARRYSAEDTHGSLDAIAETVGAQLQVLDPPIVVLGHSQAAGILDRLPDGAFPDAAVVVAPPPRAGPPVEVPAPGERGPGKPGGDAARILAAALDGIGLPGFDVDAPAAPVHLDDRPGAPRRGTRRLAVWALGDSVWLQGDWRRPGEVNVVAISDHVGAVNDERAVSAARRFFAGAPVSSDSASWRGALAAALRYAFEPWRPG
ncbi:MAG: hypothetical protein M3323_08470 [Actinomycetota bacterium]|nr:hypothetical protein [Actinomycetota bacterium]